MNQIYAKIPPSALPKSTHDKIAWLQLTRSRRVGPATFVRLINEHGTCGDALNALPDIAHAAGAKGYAPYDPKAAEREYDQGIDLGLTPLFLGHADYPVLLADAPDAPAFLWARGNTALASQTCVSLVGARNASSLGTRLARRIAQELGELGYTVVSGLARGIDTAVHEGSIDTGTIAVQAGGIFTPYPKENEKLQSQIGEIGLCLSEQPIGLIPQARHFPQRNRIIAGLSLAVVVVEGAARSGSLITARSAADLGRDVMAVPGSPLDPRAAGCNMLIRDGSVLVRCAADIHEALETPQIELQPTLFNETQSSKIDISDAEITKRILDTLSVTAIAEDVVIRDTGLPPTEVARHITTLELSGQVQRAAGGFLSLAS
jgi:DNA processing protein